MAKQKAGKEQGRQQMTGLERLGLRVSSMINSPKAQLERTAHIHQLDTDSAEDWKAVMELLHETDGLGLAYTDDGVIVSWDAPTDDDRPATADELEAIEEPAPF